MDNWKRRQYITAAIYQRLLFCKKTKQIDSSARIKIADESQDY